jgi:hypothetical protein
MSQPNEQPSKEYAGLSPAARAPEPTDQKRGDSPEGDLYTDVRRFLAYVNDVRTGRVKRLDRDVVLNLSANMERHL